MPVPIINFFNENSNLDDSYGSGSMFVREWREKFDDAIELIEPDWRNEGLVEEILDSVELISSEFKDGDLEEACKKLEGFEESSDEDEESKDTKLTRKHPVSKKLAPKKRAAPKKVAAPKKQAVPKKAAPSRRAR